MLVVDNDMVTVVNDDGQKEEYPIGTPEAFEILSRLWLRSGWDTKYVYSFTWLGRPIIQLPEDMFRLQEVIFRLQPDAIVETGVAHGGSLVYHASLCKLLGKGRVIGIDVEIRPHNRRAIEDHALSEYITLIEGDSVSDEVVNQVKPLIGNDETVLVLLDSCHTKSHVLAELNAYSSLVSPESYIVAMDGIMSEVVGAPRTSPDWTWNNPRQAATEFVKNNPDFELDEPSFLFNEGQVKARVTYWPCAFIKRVAKANTSLRLSKSVA